jgi:hypothetical protein
VSRYHGKAGRLYMDTTGAGTATPVAQLESWTIDMTTDTAEVSAFGDLNKEYVQGLFDVKGQLKGFWNDADTTLMTARGSTSPVKVYLYPATSASTKYAYGLAWVSLQMEAPINGPVRMSGNWVAGGDWGFNW